jgi:hypothetical protein
VLCYFIPNLGITDACVSQNSGCNGMEKYLTDKVKSDVARQSGRTTAQTDNHWQLISMVAGRWQKETTMLSTSEDSQGDSVSAGDLSVAGRPLTHQKSHSRPDGLPTNLCH